MIAEQDWQSLNRYCGLKLKEDQKQPFYKALRVYALIELNKHQDADDLLTEIKPAKQQDPLVVKFLTLSLIKLGQETTCQQMLSQACLAHPTNLHLGE